MPASKNIRVRAVRAELRAAPSVLRTSSGRTVHGDRRPAGPYGPAECMNGRRPVWHGWAGPNRAPCLLPCSDRTLEPSPVRLSGVCGRQDMAGRASTSAEGDDWTFEIDVWYDSGVEETAQFHRRRARWRSPCQPSLHRGRGGGLEQLLRSPRRPMTADLRPARLQAISARPGLAALARAAAGEGL